ncbi:MAG TPA: WYL domain-containing protein [Methylomirabilota bacterium]|nr:WYL domain-containing protein [Methylomirabilota bacterium]
MDTQNLYQYLLPFEELEELEGLKIQPNTSAGVHHRHPINFSFWIDESVTKSELSRHWLTYTIKREEIYLDERRLQRRRILVQAEDYSERYILQQLHKYADKAELIDPPQLREQMRKEVSRMYSYYQK